MEDNTLVQSSFSATINAPMEKVDIPSWCFTLPESEYQSCSPAHVSAGSTTAPDGRRMSINVEVLGGSMIVQHYVEEIGQPDHLRLVSTSDVFTPTGRTKIGVIWDLAVRRIDDKTCEFTNTAWRFELAVRAHSWNGPANAACACIALTPGRKGAIGTTKS